MRPVYITRLSKFLPNDPVGNDEMEGVLGIINGKPSKARSIVLRNNGIKTRHYAFRNGQSTHTNVELAANAINALFDNKSDLEKVDILAIGTGTPDQLIPSHASMVHGALDTTKNMELISAAGTCCSSMQALKYAFMAIKAGMAENAIGCGSERISTWMEASRFQPEAENLSTLETNGYIAFEKDFLRWMLSDGAAAALVQAEPNKDSLSYRIEWIETISYANELETCMYAGATKDLTSGILTGWSEHETAEWTNESIFSLKQDTRLLAEHIVPKGGQFLHDLMKKHNFGSDDVNYFLPHMSSEFFKQKIKDNMALAGLELSDEKWFYNLPKVGNVGSASVYFMLEELMNSGKAKKGDGILVMVPESARFTYAYMYLTVV